MSDELPLETTTEEVAKVCGVSVHQIWSYQRDGVCPRGKSKGRSPLHATVQGIIKHNQSLARAKGRGDAKGALVEEQTRKLKLENDVKEGLLVDMALAVEAVKTLAGVVQSELANWPARMTRNNPEMEVAASLDRIRKTADDAINDLLGVVDEMEDGDENEEMADSAEFETI